MKGKKLISSIMAVAMTASAMSVIASAEAAPMGTYEVTGGYSAPEVNADVPDALQVFINPYKASISVDSATTTEGDKTFASGLVSPTYKVINNDTSLGLNVTATTLAGKASKGIEVAEAPIDEASTDKLVFAYLNTTKLAIGGKPTFLNTSYSAEDGSQLAFTTESTKKMNIMALDKSGGTAPTGYFRVEGQVSTNPETAWTVADTVALSLILDLAPSSGVERDCSLTNLVTKTSGSNLVVDSKGNPVDKTSFDVKVADFTLANATVTTKDAADLTNATPTTADAKVYVLVNGAVLNATALQPALNTGVISLAGAGTYTTKAGDTVQILVKIGDYSKTYTINIVA